MADIAEFAEDRYIATPRNAERYRNLVDAGRSIAKKSTVVITGLARNLGNIIGKTMARLERTGSMFLDYRVVVYENDSVDNTLEQLMDWYRINKLKINILSQVLDHPINPGTRCLDRATRMALYRNTCREYIINNYSNFDYVMVVDMDLPGGWSYDGISNTLGQSTQLNWDMVGSNGIIYKDTAQYQSMPLFYDAWAFRWRHSWDPVRGSDINEKRWFRGEPMLLVNSCFGGLGMYTMAAFSSGATYDGSDCEHVPFHRKLIELGHDKIFLNPSQIVCY
jgi:hypothetical protein